MRPSLATALALFALLALPAGAAATTDNTRYEPWPEGMAKAAGFVPNDPGNGAGWQALQWNFLAGNGVNAPDAWENLLAAGQPGGKGTVVAVLDSGVAYADKGRFRRSPDFTRDQFVPGYDFVRDDPHPNDAFGHGTFVAGIIAEATNNDVGVTGLAYGAKLMPVRVLNRDGLGDDGDIAKGIRWATDNGADVINLSLVFHAAQRRQGIPEIFPALAYARRKGVFVVAPSGNDGIAPVALPARDRSVVAVGATTRAGCVAEYSNTGSALDIVAPGGGPSRAGSGDPACDALDTDEDYIFQFGFARDGSTRSFGFPRRADGTSFASPHVAAAAALVIASGRLGRDPKPAAVLRHLQATARDLGTPGRDDLTGSGLVDAAAATRPG